MLAKSKWNNIKQKLIIVEGWARDGLTDEQIAKNLGISKDTFYKYKKEHPDFSDSLKKGKEIVDYEVENALLKRALGYKYDEVTQERVLKKGDRGQPMVDLHGFPLYELVTTKIVTKEINPDTTAQIFWLKNRRPDKWRDKQDVEMKGSMDINNNPLSGMTTEELKKLISDDQ